MARSITINFARLTATPQVSFDPVSGQGTIHATYLVGEREQLQGQDDNGNPISVPYYREHPSATQLGAVQIALGPSDVAGTKMQEMIATIAQQEGLDLTAGDEVITSSQ